MSIIDTKDFNYSTWEQGEDHLFSSTEDRLNEKNWDSVLDAVLTDIAKITVYGIPAGGDSVNIAIMKKPSELTASQYEIRYFGFDFSHKHRRLTIPKLAISNSPDVSKAIEILSSVLNRVFDYEFGAFWERSNKLVTLKNQLVEKYIKEIVARMKRLSGCVHT